MQDRFKFRVWNKKNRKIYDWDFLANSKEDCTFFWCMHQAQNDEKNNILMQCTGLEDKNGKLIYEGDIVEQNGRQYIVNWGYGSFCFKDINTNKNYTVEFVVPERQKIIGNIYENPDMLEEK